MGTIHPPEPVLLLLAAFSRHGAALDWTRDRGASAWGKIAMSSEPFRFDQTDYYAPTMGTGLVKQFHGFERLIDQGELAAIKALTNDWEVEYAAQSSHLEARPLNLDPGYITPAKLVLASTKDFAHRLYLDDGIYAEITLGYQQGAWVAHKLTFPDYRRVEYHRFFSKCRDFLRMQGSELTEPSKSP